MKTRPALVFGAVGAISAFGIFALLGTPIGKGWGALPAVTGLSAGVVGSLLWTRFFRQRPPTVLRGALAGSLTALLAYPLIWYLILLGYWFWSFVAPEYREVVPPWTAVPAALVFAAWGIVLTGWVSVPVGAVTGGLLALWDLRRQRPTAI